MARLRGPILKESVAVLGCYFARRPSSLIPWVHTLAASLVTLAVACRHEATPVVPDVRPVRSVTIAKRETGVPVVLTGTVRAEDEAPLAFRVSGRMIERRVNNGDRVRPGQVIARLGTQNEQNNLRAARANLSAAQGQLTNARNNLRRLEPLAARGAASQTELDQARESFQTAQSQVESAEAQVKFAEDQLAFTELKADATGVITAVGAEPGEVVAAGRMIVALARQGARDAVFDVPGPVIRTAPKNPEITVSLKDDDRKSTRLNSSHLGI